MMSDGDSNSGSSPIDHLVTYPRRNIRDMLPICLQSPECDMLEALQRRVVPPWEHDILLADIYRTLLETEVSTLLGKEYLSPWLGDTCKQWPVKGMVFGFNRRPMVTMSTAWRSGVPLAVHYLVDTASPATYLSDDSLQAMAVGAGHKMECAKFATVRVNIHGYNFDVYHSPLESHFRDVNVIGSDFLAMVDVKLIVDYGEAKEVVLQQGPMRFMHSPTSPSE